MMEPFPCFDFIIGGFDDDYEYVCVGFEGNVFAAPRVSDYNSHTVSCIEFLEARVDARASRARLCTRYQRDNGKIVELVLFHLRIDNDELGRDFTRMIADDAAKWMEEPMRRIILNSLFYRDGTNVAKPKSTSSHCACTV